MKWPPRAIWPWFKEFHFKSSFHREGCKTNDRYAICLYDPTREKAVRENPQIFPNCKLKNILSAATTTTAASGGNREELLGQRPARRKCRPRHDADAGCRNPIAEAIPNHPPPLLHFWGKRCRIQSQSNTGELVQRAERKYSKLRPFYLMRIMPP